MLAKGQTTMTLLHHNAFNPWRDFDRLLGARQLQGNWTPAFDITETDDAYKLTGDLPGMPQRDIEVRVEDGILTVRGERKGPENGNLDRHRRIERRHGKFTRAFRLPDDVNEDEVKAAYENGVLVLTLPRQEPVDTARVITVN